MTKQRIPKWFKPREFPQYGEGTYATYFLDRYGIMIEVVCHSRG